MSHETDQKLTTEKTEQPNERSEQSSVTEKFQSEAQSELSSNQSIFGSKGDTTGGALPKLTLEDGGTRSGTTEGGEAGPKKPHETRPGTQEGGEAGPKKPHETRPGTQEGGEAGPKKPHETRPGTQEGGEAGPKKPHETRSPTRDNPKNQLWEVGEPKPEGTGPMWDKARAALIAAGKKMGSKLDK